MVYMPTILWAKLFNLRRNWRWALRCLIRIRRGEEPNTVFEWMPVDERQALQGVTPVSDEALRKHSETIFRIACLVAYKNMSASEAIADEAKRISRETGQNWKRAEEDLHEIYYSYGGPKRANFLKGMRASKD